MKITVEFVVTGERAFGGSSSIPSSLQEALFCGIDRDPKALDWLDENVQSIVVKDWKA